MALLVGHHAFACWNGDRRLRDAHGARFDAVAARTSVVPFLAVAEGRQVLPPDYWRELARAPYALIVAGTLGAYAAHPYMQVAWAGGWQWQSRGRLVVMMVRVGGGGGVAVSLAT